MIKITKILIVFIMLFNSAFSKDLDPKSIIAKANKEYKNQNFEAALESYSSVLHQGLVSSELYYNIGNTYYRMGRMGYAILNYEKALKLAPGDEDIKHNLSVANAHTADKIEVLPKLFLIEWWDSLVMLFTVNGWAFIFILTFILFLSTIGFYYYFRNSEYQKSLFFLGIFNLILLVFVFTLFLVRLNDETSNEFGILIETSANVKVSPDYDSNDAFIIHEGIKFKIEDKVENWTKIKLKDGKVGWLNNNNYKSI
jgi:tetratricopeptide (TPR) repeat protein